MQMQANFMIQQGNNAMNQAQFDSRAEGNFLGGAIHVGQDHAGVSQFNDFMEGLTGGTEFNVNPMNFGGFGAGGFGAGGFGGLGGAFGMGGNQASNPNLNTANNSMMAGPGIADPYSQPGGFNTNYNASMESQPLINNDPYANQGFGYGQPNPGPDPNYGMGINYGDPYAQGGFGNNPQPYVDGNNSQPYSGAINPGFNPFGNNQGGFVGDAWNLANNEMNGMASNFNAEVNAGMNMMNGAFGFSAGEQPKKKKAKK